MTSRLWASTLPTTQKPSDMPESRKRKPKRRNIQRLARIDGERFTVRACCKVHVTIGVRRMKAQHDNNCAALNDQSADGYARRVRATIAIADRLSEKGIATTTVIRTAGHEPVLVFSDDLADLAQALADRQRR